MQKQKLTSLYYPVRTGLNNKEAIAKGGTQKVMVKREYKYPTIFLAIDPNELSNVDDLTIYFK